MREQREVKVNVKEGWVQDDSPGLPITPGVRRIHYPIGVDGSEAKAVAHNPDGYFLGEKACNASDERARQISKQ